MKVVLGSSNYGRKKQVTIYKRLHCDNCKQESENVIHTDTSNNEYGGLSLCEKCIFQLICNFKKGDFKPITECKLCHENFEVNDPKEVNDKLCEYCMRHYEYKSKLLQLNFNTIDDYLEYEKIKMKFSFVLMYINKHKNNDKHDDCNYEYEDDSNYSW